VDVEQQPEAGARTRGETDLRIDGDIVTLIRTGRRPGIAATPTGATAGSITTATSSGGGRGCSSGFAVARIGGGALFIARRYRQILEDAR